RTSGIRLVVVGVRRRDAGALRRGRAGPRTDLALCGDEAGGRAPGARLCASLPDADHLLAVLYRVRTPPAARPGHPSLHRLDRAGAPGAHARRWFERAGLYLY